MSRPASTGGIVVGGRSVVSFGGSKRRGKENQACRKATWGEQKTVRRPGEVGASKLGAKGGLK